MGAEDATCPGEEPQTCCHEANIEQQCTDYEADGYSCQEKCLDFAQDLPREEERKVKTAYYFPKQATCPRNEVCCKRTAEPIVIPPPPIVLETPTTCGTHNPNGI